MVVPQEVVLRAMVFQPMGRNENCPHMNKKKKTRGSRLSKKYPPPSFSRDKKWALALIVESKGTFLRHEPNLSLRDY
jgi:hypothetical protein